jgi:hypothetical protein
MNQYDKGQLVRCYGTFSDEAGTTATDPTTITFKFKNPAGTTTTYVYGTDSQLVKIGTGRYRVDVSGSSAGVWWYRFEGTGTVQAADEGQFLIEAGGF